ncbi:pectinesterase inhibitor 1-like [Vicia villosa]|uniref:pectinesterase inhibitor 1-like n=1 Tax=Vicia villosa TaxID=3911 RepID=UPI00273BCCB1|nr:pectinesterase inhibitor 1-like [Vicia villosa]
MAHFSSVAMIFLLCVASSSYAVKTVDVNTICKGVKNTSFCVTLLNSKPGTSRDLLSLANYTIDVTLANTTNTIKLLQSLISKSGGDAEAKYHYNGCLSHFKAIAGMLGAARYHMKSGEYDTVLEEAVAVRIHVDNCISGDSPGDPHYPYHDKSMLPKYANMVDQVAQVFAAVMDFLNPAI